MAAPVEKHKRPPVGAITHVAISCQVMVGPHTLNQFNRAATRDGWTILQDDGGIWLGRGVKGPGMVAAQQHWSFVPWDSVNYVAYDAAEPHE